MRGKTLFHVLGRFFLSFVLSAHYSKYLYIAFPKFGHLSNVSKCHMAEPITVTFSFSFIYWSSFIYSIDRTFFAFILNKTYIGNIFFPMYEMQSSHIRNSHFSKQTFPPPVSLHELPNQLIWKPPKKKKIRWCLVLVCFATAESISSHLIKCCRSASGYAQGVL